MSGEASKGLARAAGLRDLDTPALEDVDRRRTQLWLLSLLVGCTVPAVMLVLGWEALPDTLRDAIDVRTVRLALLAMLVAVLGYVAEREQTLRRLARMLLDERVVTAALLARVEELDLLLRASRAMNSSLDLPAVLDIILDAAAELLRAQGKIQLAEELDREAAREALLIGDGSALVVPLEVRDELVGVLTLTPAAGREPFSPLDLRSVAVFAETAAAAIANARHHVQALRDLDRRRGEALATVTHELRTPLTAVIGLTGTISAGVGRLPESELRALAERARAEGWRLDRLVDDLLRAAHAERGGLRLAPERADAAAVVADAVAALRPSIHEHRLSVTLPDEPLVMGMDADAVARILGNLVGNAVKYTPAGSLIEVALASCPGGAELTVTDNGPGMPADEREAAFEKFRRGPNDRSGELGLGLGLYLVRALAEAHGGQARLEAAPGGGLRARCLLADLPTRNRKGVPEAVEVG